MLKSDDKQASWIWFLVFIFKQKSLTADTLSCYLCCNCSVNTKWAQIASMQCSAPRHLDLHSAIGHLQWLLALWLFVQEFQNNMHAFANQGSFCLHSIISDCQEIVKPLQVESESVY